MQIAEFTGINPAHVKVVLGRLRKDGKVIRDNHTYLCAPDAVPSYLQNIPDDAGEPTSGELAEEYEAWVAAGGLDAVEEEIEAPVMFTPAAAGRRMSTLPDFDMELEAELVTVEPALQVVAKLTWGSDLPGGGKPPHYTFAALKREARAKRRARAQWVPDRFQADMERIEAQFALDQPAGKID
jgi:hypothetical protein